MRAQDCDAVTQIHDDLSRNGFWQVAQIAAAKLDAAERTRAKVWAQAWCADAKARASAIA
ncbi:MAG TPA: hypothetical protein VMV48_12025 [Gallionellaceae bacterium]|nr:hypothetical protein [Gallionellaceae bacterium]